MYEQLRQKSLMNPQVFTTHIVRTLMFTKTTHQVSWEGGRKAALGWVGWARGSSTPVRVKWPTAMQRNKGQSGSVDSALAQCCHLCPLLCPCLLHPCHPYPHLWPSPLILMGRTNNCWPASLCKENGKCIVCPVEWHYAQLVSTDENMCSQNLFADR